MLSSHTFYNKENTEKNICKTTFASALLKQRRDGGEKKKLLNGHLQIFLRYTET